jgi:hypothetical protein
MNDFTTMAERLFGATTPVSQPDHGVEFRAQLAGTAPLPPLPGHKPSTEEEKAQVMFGDSDPQLQFGDQIREIESAVLEQLGDPAEAAQTAAEWAESFQSLGLSHAEAATLTEAGISAMTSQPTPELVTSWTEASQQVLLQDYGPRGAHQALADAKTFITRFGTPELRDVLNMTGLGNHPEVVRVIARKARAARTSGLLR